METNGDVVVSHYVLITNCIDECEDTITFVVKLSVSFRQCSNFQIKRKTWDVRSHRWR